ncbi:MAG: hypothetical protein Q7W05_10315 [Deltaproteobacteria bacterium]|nr:hypothetical protein [Deltaproteobacteria bacterium]
MTNLAIIVVFFEVKFMAENNRIGIFKFNRYVLVFSRANYNRG